MDPTHPAGRTTRHNRTIDPNKFSEQEKSSQAKQEYQLRLVAISNHYNKREYDDAALKTLELPDLTPEKGAGSFFPLFREKIFQIIVKKEAKRLDSPFLEKLKKEVIAARKLQKMKTAEDKQDAIPAQSSSSADPQQSELERLERELADFKKESEVALNQKRKELEDLQKQFDAELGKNAGNEDTDSEEPVKKAAKQTAAKAKTRPISAKSQEPVNFPTTLGKS